MQTGFLFKSYRHDGKDYSYVVYVPRAYDAGRKWPAILFLHGKGESGADGQKQAIQGLGGNILWHAERWPCIVIMPQKPDAEQQWEAYDAVVMAMLERTEREYEIDPDRIALTGLSQGGHGTWAFGAAHPERWCALAPICGYAGGLSPAEIAAKVKDVPVWCFHGADDDVVSPEESRKIAAAIREAGGDVKLTVYPGVNHASWHPAYAEEALPGWLLRAR